MTKLKIRLVGDRILVQHVEDKEQMRDGIVIPDSAKGKPQEAKVIAVGAGPRLKDGTLRNFAVAVGDKVLVNKYGGSEVKLNEQQYTFVREDDILGILS